VVGSRADDLVFDLKGEEIFDNLEGKTPPSSAIDKSEFSE